MRAYQLLAAVAFAAPALALAQVGPNPAVNGSQDPTVGKSTDSATAPDDVAVGVDASASTMTLPSGDAAADNMTADNTTDADANVSATGTAAAPLSPPAAAAKKATAPTSETARKPR